MAETVPEKKVSMNKLFSKFKKKTGSKRSFKDFINKVKESGVLEKVIDMAYKGDSNKPTPADITPAKGKGEDKKDDTILGMQPWMAYTAGGILLLGIGLGLFRLYKSKIG